MLKAQLEAKTTQALVMSQQMQNSIKILQMNSQELQEYLALEVASNPFLELDNKIDTAIPQDNHGPEYDNNWQQENYTRYEKNSHDINTLPEVQMGLREFLEKQINLFSLQPVEKFIAMHMLDNIDENGYLQISLVEISKNYHIQLSHIELILRKLQQCEPSGVFAIDLADCLKIQLLERNQFNHSMEQLLQHLPLLAKLEWKQLAKTLGISLEELQQMITLIKELDPKPGRNYSNDIARIISPDARIMRDLQGKWHVILLQDAKLWINHTLYQQAIINCKQKEEKTFCKENIAKAEWLHKAITLRSETLYKVLVEILTVQREFFEKGVQHLKPMRLDDVAHKIGVHASTVSRIGNKYIQTPFGCMTVKAFFSNALASNYSDDQISATSIKQKLKQLIEREDKVLSDDELAKILSNDGVVISRRTVNKYREAMNIPASHMRKKTKHTGNRY